MRFVRAVFGAIVALVILFEEWGWEPLARLLAAFGRLPFVGWLERRIAALPPRLALVVFFVPALIATRIAWLRDANSCSLPGT